jgi:hypothetical protein
MSKNIKFTEGIETCNYEGESHKRCGNKPHKYFFWAEDNKFRYLMARCHDHLPQYTEEYVVRFEEILYEEAVICEVMSK